GSDPGALLEGFLVGELMPEDRQRFESWIALDPARDLTVAALRHPDDHDIGTPPGDDPDVLAWWGECGDQVRAEKRAAAVDLPEMRKELRIGRAPAVTHW